MVYSYTRNCSYLVQNPLLDIIISSMFIPIKNRNIYIEQPETRFKIIITRKQKIESFHLPSTNNLYIFEMLPAYREEGFQNRVRDAIMTVKKRALLGHHIGGDKVEKKNYHESDEQ